jgi:ATP-dependent Clp protease, protease subunit
LEKIERDMDRDFFMSPYEAKEYRLIDQVIETRLSPESIAQAIK